MYGIMIRATIGRSDRKVLERSLYGSVFHHVQCLGGFRLTRGFTKEMLRSGRWHRLPFKVDTMLLRDFLHSTDGLCESGVLEIKVAGKIMSVSL